MTGDRECLKTTNNFYRQFSKSSFTDFNLNQK